MQQVGVDEAVVESVKRRFMRSKVSRANVRHLIEGVEGIQIHIRTLNNKNLIKYGSGDKVYKIGLIDDHYIPILETDVASFALKNHKNLLNKKRWWEFVAHDRRISKKQTGMDTWELLKAFREVPDLLKPLTCSDERVYRHLMWRTMDKNNFEDLHVSKTDARIKHGYMRKTNYVVELFESLDPQGVAALKQTSVDEIVELMDKDGISTKEARDLVEYARKRVGRGYGPVSYGFSKRAGEKDSFGGRLFANRGVQGLKSDIRGLLLGRKTTDFDFSNCHPRIIVWLCKKEGISCPFMEYFVENRQAVYDGMGEGAKTRILEAINSHDRHTPGISKDFYEELQRIRNEVCELDVARQFDEQARNGNNRKGSLFNLVLCHYENEFILDAMDYFQEELGMRVCTLMFDGLMVYGDHYAEANAICDKVTHHLQMRHGIHMPMTAKAQKTTLHPLLHRFNEDGERDEKSEENWLKSRREIRCKMSKLVRLDMGEAERLYRKFHRLGLNHRQQINEIRKSIKNLSVHGDFYLDCETCPFDKHKAYAVSVTQGGEGGPTFCATVKDCEDPVRSALSWIIDRANLNFGARDFQEKADLKARVHIHNLTYDMGQIISKLSRISTVERGTDLYGCRGRYVDLLGKDGKARAITLHFVDTLKVIPHALSKFGDMFGLTVSKEFMPHSMMTEHFVFKQGGIATRGKLLREVKGKSSRVTLFQNLKRWDCEVSPG
eukprot:scaffold3523_cov32-Tisochrysis_lutea.AAC.1